MRRTATPLILVFLVLLAIQAFLIAARFHYGFVWVAWPMPLIALLIPATGYMAFSDLAIRPCAFKTDWIHLLAPALGLLLRLFHPFLLDIFIPLVFALYAVLMLRRLWPGPDALPQVRLEAGPMSLSIWRFIACCLLISALVDVLVAIDLTFDDGEWSMAIIGTAQSIQLFAFGLLSLSRTNDVINPHVEEIGGDAKRTDRVPVKIDVENSAKKVPDDANLSKNDRQNDQRLLERVQNLMTQQRLYQDADLSLSRLARRLGVPAKSLSIAINRLEAQNVSQWVNSYRVADACRQMEQGQVSITVASLEAGFRTKSNFNREFRRIKGVSPSQWLKSRVPD